jgi:proteasome lid subunit RPN8/RPN11
VTVPAAPVVIRLEPDAASAIARAAEAAYPNEACGILIGCIGEDGWLVIQAVAGANVHPEPRHRFEVDPRLVFDWMRRLRGGPHALIGHFHSHPDGPAEPSATDRESAYDRSAIWLIAAVPGGRLGALRAFRLGKGADPPFVEVPMERPGRSGPAGGT